jgi:hypothetical protein
MPEPIIDPTTSAVEENRPRLCTSRGALAEASDSGMELGSEVVTG